LLVVECPKRHADSSTSGKETYAYYAGYSLSFAEQLIKNVPLEDDSLILDPWNGSGTTTLAASHAGIRSAGSDLNPVMVVVAKARSLGLTTSPSILPLWEKIKTAAREKGQGNNASADPLRDWFTENGVTTFRRVERSIKSHLISRSFGQMTDPLFVDKMSDLAAFFYVALFRATRLLTVSFKTSNPTWIRRPRTEEEKISISLKQMLNLVESELMDELTSQDMCTKQKDTNIATAELTVRCSEKLKIKDDSVDLVLTSPPYCTRIDYAVATAAELAVLGFDKKTNFTALRHSLMGTTTVPAIAPKMAMCLGETCNELLNRISEHSSIASNTYYLKNHIRYFVSLQRSIAEIVRVLKPHGIATFVVQDSAYKDVHNDLPAIVAEMGSSLGLIEFQRDEFSLGASLASINSRSRRYKPGGFKPTESVVSFYKQQ
jgi:DNA modification methylase